MTTTDRARWYPQQPPGLPGETNEAYTNRLLGISGPGPYDHRRNRQCSIGYHEECSDPAGMACECPCHPVRRDAKLSVADWNVRHPIGTRVEFIPGADEPPVITTGPATFQPIRFSPVDGWPVVPLDTFKRPVELSWVVAT